MSTIIIDDRDTSIIYSSGGDDWRQVGNNEEFMGTATRTVVKGATAMVPFRGTSIQVFGTINQGTVSSFSIDGSPPAQFRQILDSGPEKLFQQPFYTSPSLPDGEHLLLITNVNEDYPLVLDYMVINLNLSTSSAVVVPTPTLSTQIRVVTTTAKPESATRNEAHTASSSQTVCLTVACSSGSITAITSIQPAAAILTSQTSLSPSISSTFTNTLLPPYPAASTVHQTTFPKIGIIALAVGSIVVVGTIIILCLWRQKKKRQKDLLRPFPFPPAYPPANIPSLPTGSTSGHPPLSDPPVDKTQHQVLQITRQDPLTGHSLAGGPSQFRSPAVYSARINTSPLYLPHSSPGIHKEERDIILAPLRYYETPGTSNTSGSAASRSSLLPLQDRVYSSATHRPAGSSSSSSEKLGIPPPRPRKAFLTIGTSSAMNFLPATLHQRSVSLNVAERGDNATRQSASGSGGAATVGSRGCEADFDELPPYPGSARWSRKITA